MTNRDKFKVGDRVRFTDDTNVFKVGDVATVVQTHGDGLPLGSNAQHTHRCFREAAAELMVGEKKPRFEVGQRVVVARGAYANTRYFDGPAVIAQVHDDGLTVESAAGWGDNDIGPGKYWWVPMAHCDLFVSPAAPFEVPAPAPRSDREIAADYLKARLLELAEEGEDRTFDEDAEFDALESTLLHSFELRLETRREFVAA